MAEAIKRLSGPESLSADVSSPTTIFTVPPRKIYLIRDLTMVGKATSGGASSSTPSVLLGKTNLTTSSNVFFGQTVESVAGGYATETASLAIPFTENEVVVGAVDGLPLVVRYDYLGGANDTTHDIASSTDAASYNSASEVTNWAGTTNRLPTNVFFLIANTKATTPDAVSSITDTHSPPVDTIGSIVTVATSTIRGSIWGGRVTGEDTGGGTYTINFGGATQTGCLADSMNFKGASYAFGTPGTTNTILQTATNSGTTETAQSVTMTPTTTKGSFQIALFATTGVASSYTAGTGGTELKDGTIVTPASTMQVVIYDPPVTNPSTTLASAGTSWVGVVAEIGKGGHPFTLTTSGIILDA